MLLGGCQRTPPLNAVYDRIEQKIQHGELDGAIADIERDSARFAAKGEDWAWSFRVLRAHVYIHNAEYKKTLAVLADPLPASLLFSELAVRKSTYEGYAHRYAQQYDDAEKSFAAASSLAEQYHPEMLAEVLNSYAALQSDEKKYPESEATSHRALLLSRQYRNNQQELLALGSLGATDILMERFDEAVEWNQAGLKLANSMHSPTAEVIIGNMGAGYFGLGDFENAIPLFKEAAEDARSRKLYDLEAHWLTDLAECYYAEHQYAQAEQILTQALQVSRQLDEKTALTECLNDLAAVALETGRLDTAEQYNQEEVEIERAGLDRSAIHTSQLIRARISAGKRDYRDAEALLRGILLSPSATMPLKWEAQARLAKTLDDQGKPALAETQYQEAIRKIESARADRAREELQFSFLTSSIEFYEDYVDFLVAHGRVEDALQVAELSRARTLMEGLTSREAASHLSAAGLRPQQVAQKIKQALLFYWIGRNKSHLWVITPQRTSYFALAKAEEIVPVVKSYRRAMRTLHDAEDAAATDGRQLYTLLVAPASKALEKETRITVLPDPSLSSLNFETLIVPRERAHFWIEDVTLRTASSLALLAKGSTHRMVREKTLLLVGNTEPLEAFPALAKAQEEMQRVEHYFPEADRSVLEGKQATPQAFLHSDPGRFTYLHFVTHGTASVTRPLDSAVILSRDGDSYKLYARDIIHQPLSAELVTISACEGANGRAYSGEGLVGLSWAFLRAGAHNVVGALWEVNDSAAPQIMDTFYGEMSRGKDAATALRTAKLGLLENKDPEIVFRKPYYWAAFQLYAGS
ncbi:MAG TPA: CHAT domain-containing protein [Candidatus Acidoferrum sp.]|nr:CHAT domain-containing protein [Candidatus Acidoferrum sp.]